MSPIEIKKLEKTEPVKIKFDELSDPGVMIVEHNGAATRNTTDTWKTQDGRTINIADMDDNHIINTLRILERNAICMAMAKYAGTSRALKGKRLENDAIWLREVHRGYTKVLAEARHRNLKTDITQKQIERLRLDVVKKANLILDGRPMESLKKSRSYKVVSSNDPEQRDPHIPRVILNILATALSNGTITEQHIRRWHAFTEETIQDIIIGVIKEGGYDEHQVIRSNPAPNVLIHREDDSNDRNYGQPGTTG
jgi:hypothetical protein